MIIAGNVEIKLIAIKKFLQSKFHVKDLGDFRDVLGLEMARSDKGIFICQRKYTLGHIHEVGLVNAKPL